MNKYEKRFYEMDRELRKQKIGHSRAVSKLGKEVVAKADQELQEQDSKILLLGYILAMGIGGLLGFMINIF